MQTAFERTGRADRGAGFYLLPALASGLALLFLAAPWSLEQKARAALHGLCAQTPSHTFVLGERALPFDARMTGIYGGFLITFIYLTAKGRHRAARLPRWSLVAALGLLVAALAVDGFNSLLLDLGRPHPYAPDNRLRLATGLGTGIALATLLCYLFAVTLWRRPRPDVRVVNWRDLAVVVPLQAPFMSLVLSGWAWLYAPVALFLLLSAIAAVASLALVAIVLARRLDFGFDTAAELRPVVAAALAVGIIVMVSLSAGRFLLERLLGVSPLT